MSDPSVVHDEDCTMNPCRCVNSELDQLRSDLGEAILARDLAESENERLRDLVVRFREQSAAAQAELTICNEQQGRLRGVLDEIYGPDVEHLRDDLRDRVRAALGDTPQEGEHCQLCGRAYYPVVWSASDDLWERVTGLTGSGGLRCPECFSHEAEKAGIYLQWRAEDLL